MPETLHDHQVTRRLRWETFFVALIAACLYVPATRFGLIWDDPIWYGNIAHLSVLDLFGPVRTFHFYRPLALLYSQLFVDAAGVVHPLLQHVGQVLFHAANAALCVVLAGRLGLTRWCAAFVGLVFALHPYVQQAVAWQVPPQPLATLAMLVVVLTAMRYLEQRRGGWLAVSTGVFAVALFYQEVVLGALAILVVLSLLATHGSLNWRRHVWLAGYVAAACGFLTLYLTVPRKGGVLGSVLRGRVAAYAVQPLMPPVGALGEGLAHQPSWIVLAAAAIFALGLVVLAWRRRPQAVLVGLTWFGALIVPTIAGLSWDYVSIGPRVVYPALVGVALLWGAALDSLSVRDIFVVRIVPRLIAVALVAILAHYTVCLQSLYAYATAHLEATVDALAARSGERVLFVGYPDRLALRRPPYPLGYWGITLAPPVQALSDYALATRGVSGVSEEVARLDANKLPWEASPYLVDMRGRRADVGTIVPKVGRYDAVYATLVSPEGKLTLREVGRSATGVDEEPLAVLGGDLRLLRGEIQLVEANMLRVTVRIEANGQRLPDDVLFMHLLTSGGAWVAGADDDLWGGYVPVAALPMAVAVDDVRYLDVSGLAPGDYAVTVGLYNRASGVRYAAVHPDGGEAWNGELQIGTLRLD